MSLKVPYLIRIMLECVLTPSLTLHYPLSALLPDSAFEGAETELGAVSKPQPKAWGT